MINVFLNNLSNNGKAVQAQSELEKLFGKEELKFFNVREIQNAADTCRVFNKDDKIIIAGGDGTLSRFVQKRANALYSEDERQVIRQSHNNPQIQALYDEFLGKPNSHKAHELLHTTYKARIGFND